MLAIANNFYTLNNIQVNKMKSVLITNEITDSSLVTLHFSTDSVTISSCKFNESIRKGYQS